MRCFIFALLLTIIPLTSAWAQDDFIEPITDEPVIQEDLTEWKQILPPVDFQFPRDHGAHFDTKIEWWYVTGNLKTNDDREFGIQVTFFRQGLPETSDSDLPEIYQNQMIIGHLAITDVKNNEFYSTRLFQQIGPAHAGAREDRMLVWIDDWELESHFEGMRFQGNIPDIDATVTINWSPEKPLVKQGDQGYSKKGPNPGNATAYLSYPRLDTKATLTLGDESFNLTGLSWFDHEWGTDLLSNGIVGWDWWGMHLDDGRDLMLSQLRYASGLGSPFSSGTIIDENGETTHLTYEDFKVVPKEYWTSTRSGARYPIKWAVVIEAHDISFTVTPKIIHSEMVAEDDTQVTYWEGPVKIEGKTTGEGYMELTGYAEHLEDKL